MTQRKQIKNLILANNGMIQTCTNNNSTPRNSSGSSVGGFWIVFIIAAIVSAFSEGLGVLILLGYGFLKLMGM